MRTGLSKKQKTTNVYFNEADSIYMANELDSIGGAIVFTSDTVTADSN